MKKNSVFRWQIVSTVLAALILGGMALGNALNPNPAWSDYYEMANDLQNHPIAAVIGSLVPTIIFSVIIYFASGALFRRVLGQYTKCQYCSETVKIDAAVCKHCGGKLLSAEAQDTSSA